MFDRYYSAKPRFVTAVLKKILLSCCITVFCMLFIITEYDLPAGLGFAAGVSAFSALMFTVLFAFVKKRFAIPAMLIVCGAAVWHNFEKLWDSLSYFADAAMLTAEGRFLYPRGYLFHEEALLSADNPLYISGIRFGMALLCIVFALVTAAAVSGRVRALPPALLFAALCVPPLIGERLEINVWLVPATAFLFGAAAISFGYSGGLVIDNSAAKEYRRLLPRENRNPRRGTEKPGYFKRIAIKQNSCSKYFSCAMYCAAVFSAVGMIAYSVHGSGTGIDYTGLYDFIAGIGEASGITASPFESGPVSEYFTSTDTERHDTANSLNIISPGTGEQNIIRVTYSGASPLYLRGDIGIDFTGTSWTTPVNNTPDAWGGELSDRYRPVEQRVVRSVIDALGTDPDSCVEMSDVAIDYLCESSVVFLPSYTADHTYYGSDVFDVYGDVVVRVNDEYGNVNRVQCTALVPAYTDTDGSSGGAGYLSAILELFRRGGITVDDIYPSVVGELSDTQGLISEYGDFVRKTYIGVPGEYREPLREYLDDSGLSASLDSLEDICGDTPEYIYSAAKVIADHLRENYTYSLRAGNDPSAPVLSFLNETHSGHCALYASAMTLLLRESGIPARYCTGFALDPSRGDGVQTLKAKNLHAWTEVYLGELGWATFDPTSSSVYPDAVRPAESGTESDSSAVSSESAEESVSSDSDSISDTGTDSVSEDDTVLSDTSAPAGEESSASLADILPYIIAAAAAAAAAVFAVYCFRRYRALGRRAESVISEMIAGMIPSAGIYEKLLSAARLAGLTPKKGEMPADFYRRADSVFGTDLGGMADALESVAFGGGDDDRAAVARQFDIMYRNICAHSSILRRIKLRMLICQK